MGNPARIYGIARATLDCVAAGLTTAGGDHMPPTRQYVADGNLVAWDCEQLCVSVEDTHSIVGNPAAESQDPDLAMAMRAATIGIWLVRCCPMMDDDGEPPTADAIDASAQVVLADPQIMVDALWNAQQAGQLATCRGLAFQRWTAVGPQGGLTGGVLRIAVALL